MDAFRFFRAANWSHRGFLRLVGVLIIVFVGIVIGQVPLAILLSQVGAHDPHDLGASIGENLSLVLMILPFITGLLMLLLAVAFLHGQAVLTLISPEAKIDWRRIAKSFVIWFALIALGEVVLYLLHPEDYQWNFVWQAWWPVFLIGLLILPLQTSFEEILFRGYLLQRLGIMFNNRWVALVLTSVLFGLMHLANPEVLAFGIPIIMTYYISVGLLLGFCTLFDQRLEIALGVHAATNFYGATMVTFKESAIQTPALFSLSQMDASIMTLLFILSAVFFFLYFARHYQWRISFSPAQTIEVDDQPPLV